jgi:hypothetical protein
VPEALSPEEAEALRHELQQTFEDATGQPGQVFVRTPGPVFLEEQAAVSRRREESVFPRYRP